MPTKQKNREWIQVLTEVLKTLWIVPRLAKFIQQSTVFMALEYLS